MIQRKPELLAPAGDMNCALAAFEAGADAVYAGVRRFNARERATSFSDADFGRLCQHARDIGRKVYLTLNILIRDDEFSDFALETAQLLRYQPDAVIVQDLGVLRFLRKFYPEVNVHASTQMGFHNAAGLQFAHELGIRRVIMERQVTFGELKNIVPKSPIETEVFIHGALCISLSGQCLLSSFQNGGSGNRGQCKQPCRRRYESQGAHGFFLSPADLALPEKITELAELGVSSFKIEGRLRKPDYVTAVTTAYRAIIDHGKSAIPEAREWLRKGCGRRFSEGFLSHRSAAKLIHADSPGIQGEHCGTVKFSRRGETGISINENELHIGDRIRFQTADGQQGAAMTLTRLGRDGKVVNHGRCGDIITVECQYVAPGTEVYRIGTSIKSFDKTAAAIPRFRDAVDFKITITPDGFSAEIQGAQWTFAAALPEAQKNPVTIATIQDAFAIAGDPNEVPFKAGKIDVELAPNRFIPAAILKEARKDFWKFVLEKIRPETFIRTAPLVELALEMQSIAPCDFEQSETIVIDNHSAIIPAFIPEEKIPQLTEDIRKILAQGGRTFYVASLGGLKLLQGIAGGQPLQIHSFHPLSASNMQAILFLKTLGFSSAMLSPELPIETMRNLAARSPLRCTVYAHGRLPQLSTRAPIPAKEQISDGKSTWVVTPPDAMGLQHLLPEEVIELSEIPRTDRVIDRRTSER